MLEELREISDPVQSQGFRLELANDQYFDLFRLLPSTLPVHYRIDIIDRLSSNQNGVQRSS